MGSNPSRQTYNSLVECLVEYTYTEYNIMLGYEMSNMHPEADQVLKRILYGNVSKVYIYKLKLCTEYQTT